jgi:hypothetical protein
MDESSRSSAISLGSSGGLVPCFDILRVQGTQHLAKLPVSGPR